jgi:hypothetical protein
LNNNKNFKSHSFEDGVVLHIFHEFAAHANLLAGDEQSCGSGFYAIKFDNPFSCSQSVFELVFGVELREEKSDILLNLMFVFEFGLEGVDILVYFDDETEIYVHAADVLLSDCAIGDFGIFAAFREGLKKHLACSIGGLFGCLEGY